MISKINVRVLGDGLGWIEITMLEYLRKKIIFKKLLKKPLKRSEKFGKVVNLS